MLVPEAAPHQPLDRFDRVFRSQFLTVQRRFSYQFLVLVLTHDGPCQVSTFPILQHPKGSFSDGGNRICRSEIDPDTFAHSYSPVTSCSSFSPLSPRPCEELFLATDSLVAFHRESFHRPNPVAHGCRSEERRVGKECRSRW